MNLIAVVDDDMSMRTSVERLLQLHGYSTRGFASAEEFLDSGVASQSAGAILDINLPGMSGIELRRWLLAADSNLPVVFMTAFDDDARRAEALALGCLAYLEKPFETQRLIDALEVSKTP